MRMFRVSFLVTEAALGTVISAVSPDISSGLSVTEHVPPAPPPPVVAGAKTQLELKVRPPARPLNEDNSITFKAAMAALALVLPGGEVTREHMAKVFTERGLKESSVSPCMTHMARKGYVVSLRPSLWLKTS